jgi:hypothetical protein
MTQCEALLLKDLRSRRVETALLVEHFCAYLTADFLVLSQCGWLRTYGYVRQHLHAVGAPLRPTADRQDVKSTGSRPRRGLHRPSVLHRGIVVAALGPQTQPRVAPLAMVAAQ